MGGHDHHELYKIPDYKIYKVEDVPLLMRTKEALEIKGLSDPWLRNEVWRYNAKEFGTEGKRGAIIFTRGFKYGAVACALTLLGTAIYDKIYPSEHGHSHGHGEHCED